MAEYKSLEHGSTVVVCSNDSEMFYFLKYAERIGKDVSRWLYDHDEFPVCLSVSDDIVGWVIELDRALYYKPFNEFLADIN